jgi:GNAT superfamily N-acetyltransferase
MKKLSNSDLRQTDVSVAPVLASLMAETFENAYQDVHSPENIRSYCEENYSVYAVEQMLRDAGVLCKLAYRDNEAVGFYLVKYHACPINLEGSSSELKLIYTLSSEYGSGVGRLLFEDCVQCIRANQASWIWLAVSKINYRAQSFYLKLGFEALGDGPSLTVGADHLTSTIMGLHI